MKYVFVALLILCSTFFLSAQLCGLYISGPSACDTVGHLTQQGFSPTSEELAPFINDQNNHVVLQFLCPTTMGNGGTPIDSLQINEILNLPWPMCYYTNKPNDIFVAGQQGCIVITGVPCDSTGQYELNLQFSSYITSWGDEFSAYAWYGFTYFVRLNNLGQPVIPVDESAMNVNTNVTKLYGPPALCSYPYITFGMGPPNYVCKNSEQTFSPFLTGGTAPFSYNWNSAGDSLSCYTCTTTSCICTQNSSYSVTVTDAYGNTATASTQSLVSNIIDSAQVSIVNTGVTCTQPVDTTVITITPVIWGPGGIIFWGDDSYDNYTNQFGSGPTVNKHSYSSPGIYYIAFTDDVCTSYIIDTIPNMAIAITPIAVTQPNCNGVNNGAVSLSSSGGTAPYTYLWNNGSTNNSINGVPAGLYTVTVTDVTSCTSSFAYNLNPLYPSLDFYTYLTTSNTNCANNGSIQTTIYNGRPPYSYQWSNADTLANIGGLAAGTYYLTVTDSPGCKSYSNASLVSICNSYVTGNAFNDINNNCVQDAGEAGLSSIIVAATSSIGRTYYGITDQNGDYNIQLGDAGLYFLAAASYPTGGNSCADITFCNNSSQRITVTQPGDTVTNVNLGVTTGVQSFDLGIYPGCTSANPGFTKEYWIYFYNNSPVSYTGPATITFTYDSNLAFQSSTEPHPTINQEAHTLVWNVDSVPAYNWGQVISYFQVPATLSLNYLLQNQFSITPFAGDCDTSNNQCQFSESVLGSHDPNEKDVEPPNNISPEDSVLTYTIHFQNNGTDSTHFVIVKDTLSPNLKPATVRNIAASSKFSSFNISSTGVLTWVFNPYRLPDSLTNALTSKGFITFSVNKRDDLALGSVINNTADIYFDYNPVIVTNSVADTVSNISAVITVAKNDDIVVKAFPNPFSDETSISITGINQSLSFELYDVTGRIQRSFAITANSLFKVERNGLASGIYLYRITAKNNPIAFGKLIVE